MRLNVNLASQKFVSKGGTSQPVNNITFIRGDQLQLDVYFYEQGSATSADLGTIPIIFGGKLADKFDGDYLFHSDTYTKLTINGDTVYRFELGLNTQQLNDALEVDAITTNDIAQISVNVELQWTIGTLVTSTVRQLATVQNDVNKGTEGLPDPANPSYATVAQMNAADSMLNNSIVQLNDAVSKKRNHYTVTDNAAKLALTGLTAGDQVTITGEGQRVEQYLGGGESSEDNWFDVVGSVEVLIDAASKTNALTILGQAATPSGVVTNLGWFRAGHKFNFTIGATLNHVARLTAVDDAAFNGNLIQQMGSIGMVRTYNSNANSSTTENYFVLPSIQKSRKLKLYFSP